MAYEQNDNSGSLFQNTRKRHGRKDPEYTGTAKVDGKEYWISLWKKDKDGKPWLSVSFRPKDAQANKPAQTNTWEKDTNDFDDSIPF